jgi:phage-related baseplate assembly protein
VSNASALIGADPEDDEPLRERCREKTGILSPNGPRDAYAFVAKSAVRSDGVPAGVTRVRSVPDGVGGVDVYVAAASGDLNGDIGDTSTDLGAVDDAIQRQAAPLAIDARVQSATPVPIVIEYSVWVRTSSRTNAEIEDIINAALARFMEAQPIGGQLIPDESTGRVYRSAIEAAIDVALESIDPDDAFVMRRTLTAPAADVDLAIDEAPTLSTITETVTQVSA